MILAFPFFLNSRINVFSHTNHTKGIKAVFFKSEAISAHAGSKFLAMPMHFDFVKFTVNEWLKAKPQALHLQIFFSARVRRAVFELARTLYFN